MKLPFLAALVICGAALAAGQGMDSLLVGELNGVRAVVAKSADALRGYTWIEYTEITVKGDVKSSTAMRCRYDAAGKLVKTPIQEGEDKGNPVATSRRPLVRSKSEKEDYLERAASLIHNYVPLNPGTLDYMLQNGRVAMASQGRDKSEIKLTYYFQKGDEVRVAYETVSKRPLNATITSTLGSPKDPVTMEAEFATLPDGVVHVANTVLTAKSKKTQIKTRNVSYEKIAQ